MTRIMITCTAMPDHMIISSGERQRERASECKYNCSEEALASGQVHCVCVVDNDPIYPFLIMIIIKPTYAYNKPTISIG